MRVGLLQCGRLPQDLVDDVGDYSRLFEALLGPHGVTIEAHDVVSGPPPASAKSCDGWLVSGSAASTFDPLPWIAPTETFLRAVVAEQVPVVGICFGHQLLAQALGGRVARAPGGWGAGVHRYDLVGPPRPWMEPDPPRSIHLVASHRDQVVALPEGAEVLARTEHCHVAAYTVGQHVLAIQPHPEYDATISRSLSQSRRELMGPEVTDQALASLDAPLDSAMVGAWMAAFLLAGRS